jgi:DNA modification methylase
MKAAAQRKTASVADLGEPYLIAPIPPTLYLGDFRAIELPPESIDWVITDPPYAKEYLPLYSDLSRCAERWLKPGGSLLVMCGQSYDGVPKGTFCRAPQAQHLEWHQSTTPA